MFININEYYFIFKSKMAHGGRKKNLVIAVIVITIALGICYIKLKYFLRSKEDLYKLGTTTSSPKLLPPSKSVGQQHQNVTKFKGTIHVAISVDSNQFQALPTMLNSLKHNSKKVKVHVLVAEKISQLKAFIGCCKVDENFEIEFQEFHLPNDFKELITVTGEPSVYGNLSSVSNFARFFLHKQFPSLTHILYLDVDNLIQHDITDLWLEVINGDQLITTTTIPDRTYGTYLKPATKIIYDRRHTKSLDLSTPCIIGGLYGANLQLWRDLDVHKEVVFWMKEHKKNKLWVLGSQPILMLVGYGRMKIVSRKWNLTGLGWNTKYSPEELHNWYILHWNGKRKPWLVNGLYKEAWNHYIPEPYDSCTKWLHKS